MAQHVEPQVFHDMEIDELLWMDAKDLDELFCLNDEGLISPCSSGPSSETTVREDPPAEWFPAAWTPGGVCPHNSAPQIPATAFPATAFAPTEPLVWTLSPRREDSRSSDCSQDNISPLSKLGCYYPVVSSLNYSPLSTMPPPPNRCTDNSMLPITAPSQQLSPSGPLTSKLNATIRQASPKLVQRRERKRLQAQRYRSAHADEVQRGERRVMELRRQLAELEQENLDLQLRSTVLANCLQRFQAMYNKLAAWQAATKQPIIMCSGLPSNPIQMQPPPVLHMSNPELHRHAHTTSYAPSNSPYMSAPDTTSSMDGSESEEHSDAVPISPADAVINERLEAFKCKTPAILAKDWSKFVYDGAAALGRLDLGDMSAEEVLGRVFDDSAQYCLDCGAANMALLSYCWSLNLENGRVHVPPLGHWRKVVGSINLSAEQLQQAVLAYGWISTQFQGVPTLAMNLCHQLDCLPMGYTGHHQQLQPQTIRKSREANPESEELYDQLKLVTEKYKMCINLSKMAVFKRIFNRIDGIRLLVYSYPFMPDPAALLIALAEKGRLQK